jgi:hypothetical protein
MIPTVKLNDHDISNHPLTTEEPSKGNPELLKEIKDMNMVDPEDKSVPTAVIVEKDDPNKLSNNGQEEDIIVDDVKPTTKNPISLPDHAEPTTVTTTTTATGALDITSPIDNEYSESDSDDELRRITESNRFIPINNTDTIEKKPRERAKSLRSQSVSTRKQLLVFANNPQLTKTSDRIIVHNYYGAGPEGQLVDDLKPKRKTRQYLVACDFSDESFHAIEWTMGTMMRDGDKLHVVTAVNREDNPEIVKEAGLSLSKELTKASETVTEESKKMLGQMLLFDVELVTYAVCGKVKDVLTRLVTKTHALIVLNANR